MYTTDRSSTLDEAKVGEEATGRISVTEETHSPEKAEECTSSTSTTAALLKSFGVSSATELAEIRDAKKLESFVQEIEGQPHLSQDVIRTVVVSLMQATSRVNTDAGAQMTERLLRASLVGDIIIDPSLRFPNADMYNLSITSWTRASISNGAHQATKVLALMVETYNKSVELVGESDSVINTAQPDRIHFTSVMHAWAKSRLHIAPQKVAMLLEQLEKESGLFEYLEENESHDKAPYVPSSLTPDRACYNTVMSTFVHSPSYSQASTVVPQLFRRLQKVHSMLGTDEFEPDTISYNLLINTIARSDPVKPRDAESVLKNMVALYRKKRDKSDTSYIATSTYPNTQTYNGIIQAWSNSGHPHASIRAESILMALIGQRDKLEELDLPVAKDVAADTYTFNSVISCWARSCLEDAGERAEQLLSLMEAGRTTSGDLVNVKADIVTYNSVMHAWAKCGRGEEGARRAEEVLNMVIDRTAIRPTVVSYSTVIHAWASSKSPMAGIKAQELLNQLEEFYDLTRDKQLRPNDSCYSGVLRAWVRQQMVADNDIDYDEDDKRPVEYAEELLDRMRLSKYVTPKTQHLNVVLEGWANSLSDDAVHRAQVMLTTAARAQGAPPNTTSFNHAIAACARPMPDTNKRRQAFFTGLDLFNRLGAEGHHQPRNYPDERTYRLMFQLFDTHIPESERTTEEHLGFAVDLFQACRKDGWMTDNVLHAVQSFFPPKMLAELIPGLPTTTEESPITLSSQNLPRKWSRKWKRKRSST